MTAAWPWVALAGLGAFHGVNPAMGWLFAVALGLQQRSGIAVLRALPPIALGHAAAIALVIAAVETLWFAFDPAPLQFAAAACLVGFGLYRLARGYRHRFRVGMVAGFRDLALWSFLMATAHGAGLMVAPLLLALPVHAASASPSHAHAATMAALGSSAWIGLLAVGVHTAAMLAVTGLIAWAVYAWAGLAVLRKSWINLDLLWSAALIGVGIVLLAAAGANFWPSAAAVEPALGQRRPPIEALDRAEKNNQLDLGARNTHVVEWRQSYRS